VRPFDSQSVNTNKIVPAINRIFNSQLSVFCIAKKQEPLPDNQQGFSLLHVFSFDLPGGGITVVGLH